MDSDPSESTVVVILDQKDDELVGFDFVSLPEANKVSGIWNLVPGVHFLYTKSREQTDVRLGEFVCLRKGEIKVLKRSRGDSGALFEHVEEFSNDDYKKSILMGHMRNRMSKIPDNLAQLWANITDCINSELILKLRPISKVIKNQPFIPDEARQLPSDTDVRNSSELREATTRVDLTGTNSLDTVEEYEQIAKNPEGLSREDLNHMKRELDSLPPTPNCQIDSTVDTDYSSIYYSDFPLLNGLVNKFKDFDPQALTKMYMDSSYVLDAMKSNYEDEKDGYKAKEFKNKYLYLLGEFQYSFLLFLLCFNYESLQHYKRLLKTFCNAEAVIINNKELTRKFLRTLRYHVEIWDDEHDVYQHDDFLTHSLNNLREIMIDNQEELNFCLDEYKFLEDSFKLKFGISFGDLEVIHNNYV